MNPPSAEPASRPSTSWLATSLAVLLAGAAMAWVQFSFDGMYDGDSYFHTRAARELSRNGIERTFPQASVSTWSERYSDKDLLYHALLIPFQAAHRLVSAEGPEEDLVTPGKLAAAFFDVGFLAAFAFALHLVGARFPVLWLALLLSTHVNVLGHLLAVRPHVLGLTLLVLEAALLARRSVLPLAILGYLHVLAHSSFALLPVLALATVAAHLLRRESLPWSSALAAVGGVVWGNLLHPYFPNNVGLAWDQLVEVARNVWGIVPVIPPDLFGSELRAATTADLLACFPGWAPALAGVVGSIAHPRARPLSTPALALLLMSLSLGALASLSATFLVFFFAVATLFAGRVFTELACDLSFAELRAAHRRELFVAAGVLFACLAAGQARASFVSLERKARSVPTRSAERTAIEFLRREAPAGDLVYHSFWRDFSALYHYRPDGRYIVALDPVFLYRHDPRLFEAMLRAQRGRPANAYEIVSGEFGARWVYVSRASESPGFLDLLLRDPRFVRVYADSFAEVYHVQGDAKNGDDSR